MSSPNSADSFVGVGVATDPAHQVGVVHRRALPGVQTHPLGDTGRDQGEPQHVFHRLAQTKVDRQRYRRQQLGFAHALILTLWGSCPM